MWLSLSYALTLLVTVRANGYCSTHTMDTNSTWMQFTKEPIPQEYAIEGNFKSIHCCGKGYRSIECIVKSARVHRRGGRRTERAAAGAGAAAGPHFSETRAHCNRENNDKTNGDTVTGSRGARAVHRQKCHE
ncbi:hypothetical protein EVAR_15667_1 [Eumeta japonica]|uniref:Uncharacterized protein n=1 Tax=Eumeta variegata TaxID=151549 RepID=A0A4C1U975_EUMVA|nr:hypothetical protein EVAR_15667_1 [Eumeta japonica]